mgnify:CR=1 FL=1
MPTRAMRVCPGAGCRQIVASGKCPRCAAKAQARESQRQAEVNSRRPAGSMSVYSSPRWRKARSEYIAQHPHCCTPGCRGLTRYLDHIRPWRSFPPEQQEAAFWDPANHQGLCRSCHSRKTAEQDGGFGNRRRA